MAIGASGFQFRKLSIEMDPHGGNQRMFAMLETMREEQENLNRELAEKEEEKARFTKIEFQHSETGQ